MSETRGANGDYGVLKRPREWLIPTLIIFTGTFLVSFIGSQFTIPNLEGWYNGLKKPALNPPAGVFGPVWTVLFLMMAWAASLVYRSDHPLRKPALAMYAAQLLLNGLWSYLFFGAQRPKWALVEILALEFAIILTALLFFKVKKLSGWLMIPYILWVAFATYLNFEIARLNP